MAISSCGALFETYRYPPGAADATPPHAHENYQFCLSLNFPGESTCRGMRHPVPVRSLGVINPDEIHSSRDLDVRTVTTIFRMVYVPPPTLTAVAEEVGKDRVRSAVVSEPPFFPNPVVMEHDLFDAFLIAHLAVEQGYTLLEREATLTAALTRLIAFGSNHPAQVRQGRERVAVRLAREYLDAHLDQNVSHTELSAVTGLKPLYLCRVFRCAVGLPPHAYQTQLRVERAKHLLIAGWSIGKTAQEVGFYDQSHFGQHFKRIIGVSPARYHVLSAARRPV